MRIAKHFVEFLRELRFFKPAPKKFDAYLVFWVAGRFALLGGWLVLLTSALLAGHFLELVIYDAEGASIVVSILAGGLVFFALGLTALYYVWPPRRQ